MKAEHPAHGWGEPGRDQAQGSPACGPSKWLKDNRTLALPPENDDYPIPRPPPPSPNQCDSEAQLGATTAHEARDVQSDTAHV